MGTNELEEEISIGRKKISHEKQLDTPSNN